jgi:hypothetical protein
LPQAYFLVPFALLPIAGSFVTWGVITQSIIAAACFILLKRFAKREQNRLFLPLVISLLFFGPVYLSLQIGSIGALALIVLLVAIVFIDEKKSLAAGLVLSLLLLKPSQGLPILGLLGFWFLINKNWTPVIGVISGSLVLLISGLFYDPQWIQVFVKNSQAVSDRTLGLQSNVYSFAYLSCNQSISCMGVVGTIGLIALLGFGCYFLWMNRQGLTTWDAFNIIILIGFVSTIYLWSYDQLLYVLPIIWIVTKLVEKSRSYLLSFLFLIGIDVLSFVALVIQARTHKDLLSIVTTVLILGICLWLLHIEKEAPIDKPYSAA